jgi:23S rRNA (uracil1939-C5)-methyltransferase
MPVAKVAKGESLELRIASAAYEGAAIGRLDTLVVFVRGGVPGDRVRARVIRCRRRYVEAVVEEVIEPSPHRVQPVCRYFGTCGGCSWQHVDYPHQLEFKRQQVHDLFERVGGFRDVEVRPTLASPDTYHYRNKMEFTFGNRRWLSRPEIDQRKTVRRDFALGLHIPGRFDRVLNLEECYLQSPLSVSIVNAVRDLAVNQAWSAWDTIANRGYLRNLVIRVSRATGQVMVYVVTSRDEPTRMRVLTRELSSRFSEISTIVSGVNSAPSPVAKGECENVLHGSGLITDSIGDLVFTLAPTTFFQPNTAQAARLYGVVESFCALRGGETIYDVYCGAGGIAVFLAGKARRVVGIENDERSVKCARQNAQANHVDNCGFEAGDARLLADAKFRAAHGRPDVVVLDPPRAGLQPDLSSALLEVAPERIVYVSCNPATQARDLQALSARYALEAVQPVDMFPHSYHIENVAVLRLRSRT